MLPTSLISEILVALLIGTVVFLLWRAGRRDQLAEDRGWFLVFMGSCLLFFGALVDISDHFPELGRFYFLGQTRLQSVAEKMIGFFGGFLLLTIGLFRWLPYVAERRRQAEDLLRQTFDLQRRLKEGSEELQMSRQRNEEQMQEHLRWMRQNQNLVEAVASGAPIALIATGGSGRISVATGRALNTLGFDAETEEIEGKHLADFLPMLAEALSKALDGATITTQFTAHGLTFQAHCTPWLEDERQVGAVVVATDISDLVLVQEQLRSAKEIAEAANLAKSHFLASMSHELRTPLNSVIGFANLLEKNKDHNLTTKNLRFLSRISDNGRHLLGLINEILDLSKIEAGRVELSRETVDLEALIRQVAIHLAPQAGGEVRLGIKLGLRNSPADSVPSTDEITADQRREGTDDGEAKPTWTLETDRSRLRQVLVNLTANALKFTHQGKVVIQLHVDHQNRPSAIAVRDTGIGIPEDKLATIFEAFQQVDSGISRQYTGTGLGLAISQSLCGLLGFDLTVESREGEGSVFTIEFPDDDEAAQDLRSERRSGRRIRSAASRPSRSGRL